MRVFVTGSTGFVGSAVVQELMARGHQVLGLVRSSTSARALAQTGAEVHRGDLTDRESLRKGAAECDAVIHTAFNHDFSKFAENCEHDRQVIAEMGAVLAGSSRPLIVTSGIGLIATDGIATEEHQVSSKIPRVASEQATLALREKGIRASLMRLPPSVHGAGDHGFVPILIGLARQKGMAAYIEDGQNLWPAVHRFDAAKAYCDAIEAHDPLPVYHGVGEEGIAFKDIASAIGAGLKLPVNSLTREEASDYFSWFLHFAELNVRASAAMTIGHLGWKPVGPGLLEDMRDTDYFDA
ncbi:3-beta hydroxysteroid dehydrogenase [Thalassospira profundimaris]|uniref:3-beta hydroxysteroid dehydrogenase n=1 Tax=Thalassospira profundimaris TaxID=502049 RepID=A0A367XM38_9PROT|nr:SDR family oxidoreductase [Thalassospira profundimaris]RCK53792.1 3-beta hydroxysteroid dehydrogenase [Thalassospira profundimaris]